MTAKRTSPTDGDDQLYERLAELLETQDRVSEANSVTARFDDPDIAAGVQAYFAAAEVVDRFAAGLTSHTGRPQLLPMPDRVGEYELVCEIGRGGAAVVYKARQAGLNRLVAIKMLHGGRPGSLHDVERLRFEAEAVAQLLHPGIVPIYDIGDHHGRPYFSMPLFEAGSLSGRLQEFVAQPRRAAELVEAIAQAVQHAHERGILHRDLKPSNILLDAGGRPHVADFGLAKRIVGDGELTRTGELIGTPAYMAPERVAGSQWAGPTTIATDVYGLGAILYVLLTGRPPFERDTPVETLLAVGTTDVIAPRTLNAAIDRDLETICLRSLEKVPSSRYSTAADVANDLRRWLTGEPITALPAGNIERLRRWGRRHPVRATIALAVAALTLLGGIGLSASYVIVNRAYEEAESHRKTAESNAAQLNRQLYVSQMSVANHQLERGELIELRHALNQFQDQPEQQGFEWRWLDRHAAAMPREVTRFTGHSHFLYGGAFSPDGKTVATCGADGTIRLWDAATGIEQRKFENGAGLSPAGVPFDENFVVFSPDGALLASSGEDGGVRLWTIADGTRRQLSPTYWAEALSVSFSSDGRRLSAGWTDGHVQVWEVESGSPVASPSSLVSPISAVGFLPSDDDLVVAELSGGINVWSLEPLQVRRQFTTGADTRCLTASPDGSFLAAAGFGGLIRIWTVRDNVVSHRLVANEGVRSLAFSPDGQRLAAAGNDGRVRVWSLPDHTLESSFKAHSATIWHVSYSPNGERLLTVSSDLTARIWDASPNVAPRDAELKTSPLRHVGFSPDGRQVAIVTTEGELSVCDAHNPPDQRKLPLRCPRTFQPVFVDRGRRLAFIDEDGAVQSWDCELGQLLSPHPLPPHSANSNPIHRCSTRLGVLDEGRLAAVTYDGEVFLHESAAWQKLPRPDGLGQAVLVGSMTAPPTLVMRFGNPSRTELWTIDGLQIAERTSIAGSVESAAVSPDGHWLALGRPDGTIELSDRSSNGSGRFLIGHHATVWSIAFSPDGRTLASASRDGTARLWNVAAGTELFVACRSEGSLFSVAFSPDGAALAVAGEPHGESGATLTILRAE